MTDKIKKLFKKKNNDAQAVMPVHHCSLCGAPETEVPIIIRSGESTYVCQKCAELIYSQMGELHKYMNDVIQADTQQIPSIKACTTDDTVSVPTPHEIKEYLDQYIIGQDDAKIKLAVAVYNHYKRICQQKSDVEITKSNCLLLGSTGSGKCVVGETEVTVRNKNTGDIINISIDDFIRKYCCDPVLLSDEKFIKTWHIANMEMLTDTGYVGITALHETVPFMTYWIITDDKKEIKCADKHILFKSGMHESFAADLNVGDSIMTDGGTAIITYKEKTGFTVPMYDFELSADSNHRYYTNGILSHNTLLAESISKLLDVPMVKVDSTVFTQAGYVGEDVESILSRLYQESGYDVEKTEKGIVFVDEIDKIARKGANPSITKDVSGEGVQQALLKLLEGSKVKIAPEGGRKHPEQPMIEIDTKNILFICAGAFVGIERQIGDRLNMHTVGFNNDTLKKQKSKDGLIRYITAEDVRSYGLIPELVGRLPIITHVDSLDKDALKRILTEPKNAIIRQYEKLLDMDGAKLTFTDEALDFIVEKAYDMKVGARALRSIVEEIMTQYMYDIPTTNEKNITVDREYAEKMYNKKHEIC